MTVHYCDECEQEFRKTPSGVTFDPSIAVYGVIPGKGPLQPAQFCSAKCAVIWIVRFL